MMGFNNNITPGGMEADRLLAVVARLDSQEDLKIGSGLEEEKKEERSFVVLPQIVIESN
jgi:hypothetical protein